jgi:peroxiredoxin
MAAFVTRIGAAFGISCMIALATGCAGSQKDVKTAGAEGGGNSGPAEVGKPAPDLSIQTLDGKKVTLADLQGKVVIIDFWATWCGPCKESFPKYEELSKKHAGKVEVIGISVDDDKSDVPDFVKQRGATFAIGWDEGHTIANRWKVETMPTAFILDATGTVRHVHAGFHDDEAAQVDKELSALEGDVTPSKSKTAVASNDKDSSKDAAAKDTSSSSDAPATDETPAPPPPKKTSKPKGKGGKKGPAKPKKKPAQPSQAA